MDTDNGKIIALIDYFLLKVLYKRFRKNYLYCMLQLRSQPDDKDSKQIC